MQDRFVAMSLFLALAASACASSARRPAPPPARRPEPLVAVWRGSPVPAERLPRTSVKASGRAAPERVRSAALRVGPTTLARRTLAAANRARRRAGSRPLRVDAALTRAARRYARELARRREVEHISATPGRRTFRDRIARAGARARIAGENLARLTAGTHTLPDRVVNAWLESPGHRQNLLDPIFSRTGIGVWLGRDGVWYVVQYYATPR